MPRPRPRSARSSNAFRDRPSAGRVKPTRGDALRLSRSTLPSRLLPVPHSSAPAVRSTRAPKTGPRPGTCGLVKPVPTPNWTTTARQSPRSDARSPRLRTPQTSTTRLVDYLGARPYANAARGRARPARRRAEPRGPGLFASGSNTSDGVATAGALGPILMVLRGWSHSTNVIIGTSSLAFTGGVDDISFIPLFRGVPGITGDLGECGESAVVRDLVLAGQPAAAFGPRSRTRNRPPPRRPKQ